MGAIHKSGKASRGKNIIKENDSRPSRTLRTRSEFLIVIGFDLALPKVRNNSPWTKKLVDSTEGMTVEKSMDVSIRYRAFEIGYGKMYSQFITILLRLSKNHQSGTDIAKSQRNEYPMERSSEVFKIISLMPLMAKM